MKPIPFKSILVHGDLLDRALKNFDRLEEPKYQIPEVFRESSYEWPGDTEGRTALALTLLSQATHRNARYLDKIISLFPQRMNPMGYFGNVQAEGIMDEQQFTGHHWVARALIEYYLWKRDARAYETLQNLVKNLVLPAKRFLQQYPLDPSVRKVEGYNAGTLLPDVIDNWRLSTDVGCAFLALDGIAHAYDILLTNDLRQLTESMIQRFLQLDLLQMKAQTHATLSALRGMLRYFEQIKDSLLLDEIERIYSLYRTVAMTENYENYGWFGRPEWTEPCATIDSFIIAVSLWRHTGEPNFLEDAHLIYFNAISHGQRGNGGFGCDTCAGSIDPFIAFSNYEAHWCCTMRGGEFFARAIESIYFTDDDTIYLPFYFDNEATIELSSGAIKLKQATKYPYEGNVKLEILESSLQSPVQLKLFLPSWVSNASLSINDQDAVFSTSKGFAEIAGIFKPGDMLEFTGDLLFQAQDIINKNNIRNYHSFRHGPLILGCDFSQEIEIHRESKFTQADAGSCHVDGTDIVLSPICDVRHVAEQAFGSYKKQILFRD